jgi:hypothetical protein
MPHWRIFSVIIPTGKISMFYGVSWKRVLPVICQFLLHIFSADPAHHGTAMTQ